MRHFVATAALLLATSALAQTDLFYNGAVTVPLYDQSAGAKRSSTVKKKGKAKFYLAVYSKGEPGGNGRLVIQYRMDTPNSDAFPVTIPQVRFAIAHDETIEFGAPVATSIVFKPQDDALVLKPHDDLLREGIESMMSGLMMSEIKDETVKAQWGRMSWTAGKGLQPIDGFSLWAGEESREAEDREIREATRTFGRLTAARIVGQSTAIDRRLGPMGLKSTLGGEITCPYRITRGGEVKGALLVHGNAYLRSDKKIRGQVKEDPREGLRIPLRWQTHDAGSVGRSKVRRLGETTTVDLGSGMNMTFVWIEGGSFAMGSPDHLDGVRLPESPVHRVTVDGFWIGQTEVTRAQYEALMWRSPRYSPFDRVGPQAPTEMVSWRDAKAFCDRLSHLTNATFRLPYEAEWEYACRAGTTTPYYTGVTIAGDQARLNKAPLPSGGPGKLAKGNEAIAVKSFAPNGWGLYDMIGNVKEWCEDWYAEDYYDSSPSKNPRGPASGTERVVRGGSWESFLDDCQSASRSSQTPDNGFGFGFGFRVVCVTPGLK